ncbi:extracellular solute-binding protein (plasmid) [Rathayibacter sp. VKM Ac-2803]|uniref:Sugar ABC transporter substrate-binding protein n=1 Tax=Rathayibacter caricis DSM 15933 TaxID=1328867 RepID=A0A2T4UNT5_9MICO|nr:MULTISPECIES: sugar ABC transporter substrate-binding protein [Rathayibacter]MWV51338.1 extracellular solute-binding protein [Rathayibacter sp. VKM Ac-2803]PTL71177.1 sugar ABC transporter substrate-binding protein [Rathayibacter caricis DSM 15933]
MQKRNVLVAGAVSAALALILSGCTSGGSDGGGDAGSVTLDYWAWAPGSAELVAAWNAEHPDIQVKHTDAGGGTDSSAKLLTASRAGNAPDLAAVEYTTLPSLIVADVPLNLTDVLTDDAKAAYTEGTLQQVTFDGQIFALPQDVGPMALMYRSDLLEQYGIPVPTTWEEFGAAAEKVKAADPTATLAALPANQTGFFAGVATQAGAKWWSVEDGTWTVGIADDASLEVADFFQNLAEKGYISTDAILTPEWNAAANTGKVLSWPSALWAPGVIEGVAPDTIGKWSMAPLPQWTAGDAAVAYQGGSGVIVTKGSDHPEEAAEFAEWMNSSKEGADLLLSEGNIYPAATSGQETAASSEPPALMPQQTDYYQTAAEISSDTIPVTWGPNYNVANTAFGDTLNKAVQDGTSWRDAFIEVQDVVVADMKKSGFEVSN